MDETTDDDAIWLEEAAYDAPSDEGVHRLRKAPIVAAVAAAATLALVMAMPRAWIERAVYELYIDAVIPAAKLPLGDMAHAAVAFAAAAIVALIVFLVMRFVDFGRLLRGGRSRADAGDAVAASPRQRRIDRHPDAPARAPFMAGSDIGDDDEFPRETAVTVAVDELAEDDSPDGFDAIDDDGPRFVETLHATPLAGNDDDAFDLGGFEVEEEDGAVATGQVFDVSHLGDALDDAGYGRGDETFDAGELDEPVDDEAALVMPRVGDGPLGDVRSRFAELFDPADAHDEEEPPRARRDLAQLSTSELIDELERRMAGRAKSDDEDGASVIAHDGAHFDRAAPRDDEREAAPAPSDDAPAPAVSGDDEASGSDDEFDDMDAALQAALGTLARMQQRSA
ncbi:MAG: hypothetical protein GW859_01125 [Sphingomonadales bacterium]|nr:hypothetical protein [Sphingomonadales bacterium]